MVIKFKKFDLGGPTVFQQSTSHPAGIAGGPIPEGSGQGLVLRVGTWLGTPLYLHQSPVMSGWYAGEPIPDGTGQGLRMVYQSLVCRVVIGGPIPDDSGQG